MAENPEQEQDGISRRDFVATAGLGAASPAVGCSATAARRTSPAVLPVPGGNGRPKNILFILTDQERHFDSLPRGYRLPGRERLMRNGVTFTTHQICSAVCTPSRSVIMTGRHIQHTGMFDNTDFPWVGNMSTDIPTIGHLRLQQHHVSTPDSSSAPAR